MQERTVVDEKGRILIPHGIRKMLGLEAGKEVVISCDETGKKATLSPTMGEETIDLRIRMDDEHGTLAKIAAFLASENFDIIMSESRSLEREKTAEWLVVGKYDGDLALLMNKLREFAYVKGVDIKNS